MKKSSLKYLLFLIISILSLCTSCSPPADTEQMQLNSSAGITNQESDLTSLPANEIAYQIGSSNLHIYYIDVGQADACLLEYDGHFMVIDTGDNDDETFMVQYLQEKGVATIDYLVGTHPHADHIGGMDAVINHFDIGSIYMPRISANTQTFEDVLTAIEDKNLSVSTPVAGEEFSFNGIPVQILSPLQTYEDTNNNSIVLKLNYDKTSFLFTGDMEIEAETDVENAGYDLSADVIKVAHHGSSTSSSLSFLQKVSPSYAIISVGANNTYGHPEEAVLRRLADLGTQVYRTDEVGTITVSSDGTTIKISTEKNKPQETDTKVDTIAESTVSYIGNRNTKKFHLPTCNSLPAEKNRVPLDTRENAIEQGFDPCKRCLSVFLK